MRVTGGEWRSRILNVPSNTSVTRPTMDQTRQAVFNILNSAAWAMKPNGQPLMMEAVILDGFAGSGAMAFEALSRGAAFATLIDNDKNAIAACQKNVDQFKCTGQTKIIKADMLRLPTNPQPPVTICFLDPPYNDAQWPDVITSLKSQNWIDAQTLLILESGSKTTRELNEALQGIITQHDQRRYGHSVVTFGNMLQ